MRNEERYFKEVAGTACKDNDIYVDSIDTLNNVGIEQVYRSGEWVKSKIYKSNGKYYIFDGKTGYKEYLFCQVYELFGEELLKYKEVVKDTIELFNSDYPDDDLGEYKNIK